MKKYLIKTNDIGMCMSVRCDFYQTCTNNSVNMFYKTKRKFEPILDSSNPWVGFSPQKYSKERLTKSKVGLARMPK